MADYVPSEFYNFIEPKKIFDHTRPQNDPVQDANFILKQKKLFEISAGSRFAIGLKAITGEEVLIRSIKSQDDHDFEIKIRNRIDQYQFTECLEENRKRDSEYKSRLKGVLRLSPYRPAANREKAIPRIIEAIEKKKKYSDKPNLLVYINFHSNELFFEDLAKAVSSQEYSDYFSSIWVFLTSSPDYNQTSLGRLYPDPFGWWQYDCGAV